MSGAPESAQEATEIRQKVVLRYRVLFRIPGDTVHVLRIWHTAQQQLRRDLQRVAEIE